LYQFDYVGARSYGSVFSDGGTNITFNWSKCWFQSTIINQIDFFTENCHCDDLLYLFKSPELLPDMEEPNDQILREYLLDVWVNFTTKGYVYSNKTDMTLLVWSDR